MDFLECSAMCDLPPPMVRNCVASHPHDIGVWRSGRANGGEDTWLMHAQKQLLQEVLGAPRRQPLFGSADLRETPADPPPNFAPDCFGRLRIARFRSREIDEFLP